VVPGEKQIGANGRNSGKEKQESDWRWLPTTMDVSLLKATCCNLLLKMSSIDERTKEEEEKALAKIFESYGMSYYHHEDDWREKFAANQLKRKKETEDSLKKKKETEDSLKKKKTEDSLNIIKTPRWTELYSDKNHILRKCKDVKDRVTILRAQQQLKRLELELELESKRANLELLIVEQQEFDYILREYREMPEREKYSWSLTNLYYSKDKIKELADKEASEKEKQQSDSKGSQT
jgi:hypothetical protein